MNSLGAHWGIIFKRRRLDITDASSAAFISSFTVAWVRAVDCRISQGWKDPKDRRHRGKNSWLFLVSSCSAECTTTLGLAHDKEDISRS